MKAILETAPLEHPGIILESVSKITEIGIEEIKGRRRDKEIQKARRMAMYLMKLSGISFSRIGQEMGNRDSVSVIVGCNWVSKALKTDTILKSIINKLENSLLYMKG